MEMANLSFSINLQSKESRIADSSRDRDIEKLGQNGMTESLGKSQSNQSLDP